MTDKQRLAKLDACLAALKKVEKAYDPMAPNWKVALANLNAVRADLTHPVSKVPALGPIVEGGQSVLLHDLTHATAGIPGFPAFDDGFGDVGRHVVAPEPCVVYRQSSSQGGDAFYIRGDSRIEYWVGHIASAPPTSRRFKKGETMARIAWIPSSDGGPHCHLGINAFPLIRRQLAHHTNYTHGAPKVGVQLAQALDT